MRHLYEVEFQYESRIENIDPTKCYQLWCYWQPITIDHFKLYVQKNDYLAERNVNADVSQLMFLLDHVCIFYLEDFCQIYLFKV